MEYNFDKINLKNCNIKSGTIEDANNILKLIKLIQPKEYWSYEHLMWQYFSPQKNVNLYLIEYDQKDYIF